MKRAGSSLLLGVTLVLAACSPPADESDRPETARDFPEPDRPVSELGANQFSTETKRDSQGEARLVMDMAAIDAGMTVADIGAGEGYYTVRLAERVGESGRVLAQDIDRSVLERLGRRVERERLDNVSIALGAGDDPHLPLESFDRVFMVHMYHEVAEPYAFLWRLWPALKEDGKVIVVDIDRPTDRHGIAPALLACEFERVGYRLDRIEQAPELSGYFAQFSRGATRPKPDEIAPCTGQESAANAEGNIATG
ncbi:class I SAM-dependent methyltransferase [Alteriqipengyuania lutimaris]|uniref:Class I SAM-dependent methyltransferase n=1 Tax=Alteriqipengyuania lutimaris TaxID=1538146 RepID=A0A395LM59_9SPHN|nr:class I SAM-dependent methyltransferase [Alteriqipengyuania lutimaris]MBB3032772.1 ubiquinone/menaquinone biosynthesis C-methylase UbiE [Alteriqipengyuania lutimaris]RDS78126.1 class I SAM-dependent methyltransferase [Alteriqipengyuania lutimaris]